MAATLDGVLVNFNIYIDNAVTPAVGSVTLPTLALSTVDTGGAGVNGTISMPIIGQLGSMELSIEWKQATKRAAELCAPGVHALEIRGVQQGIDDTGAQTLQKISIWCNVMMKNYTPGSFAPAAQTGGSMSFEVLSISEYIDDTQILKIDKKSQVFAVADSSGKLIDYFDKIREML